MRVGGDNTGHSRRSYGARAITGALTHDIWDAGAARGTRTESANFDGALIGHTPDRDGRASAGRRRERQGARSCGARPMHI